MQPFRGHARGRVAAVHHQRGVEFEAQPDRGRFAGRHRHTGGVEPHVDARHHDGRLNPDVIAGGGRAQIFNRDAAGFRDRFRDRPGARRHGNPFRRFRIVGDGPGAGGARGVDDAAACSAGGLRRQRVLGAGDNAAHGGVHHQRFQLLHGPVRPLLPKQGHEP